MRIGTHARARRLVENISISMVKCLKSPAKSCVEVGNLKSACQGENLSPDLLLFLNDLLNSSPMRMMA